MWELTIKSMLGTLSVPADLAGRLIDQGFHLLSIGSEHAEGIRDFPDLNWHDSFDRLLVSQANLADLRLMTADRVLLGPGRPFLIDATV